MKQNSLQEWGDANGYKRYIYIYILYIVKGYFLLWAPAREWQADFSRGMWKPRRAKGCPCLAWCVHVPGLGCTATHGCVHGVAQGEGIWWGWRQSSFWTSFNSRFRNLKLTSWSVGKFLNGAEKGYHERNTLEKLGRVHSLCHNRREVEQREVTGRNYSCLSSGL